MIQTPITTIARHSDSHPLFQKVADFLESTVVKDLEPGKYVIDGDRVFLIVEECQGKGREGAVLEAHRSYIDIQFCIEGADEIGIKPLKDCKNVTQDYDAQRDILFFADKPSEWITVDATQAVILFPSDAHAPLAAEGKMTKGVFKVLNHD